MPKEKKSRFWEKEFSLKEIAEKKVSLKAFVLLILPLVVLAFVAASCDDATTASNKNASTASQKWGYPNLTYYYEYKQELDLYQQRDNPNLILNAYLYSEQTGNLTCLGRVKGFGIPYGTEMSPPANPTQGSVPEPNGLYPSQSTNADWVLLVDSKGNTHLTFIEPNVIITDAVLKCTGEPLYS